MIYLVLAIASFSRSLVYPVAGVRLLVGREIHLVLALALFSLSLVYPVAGVRLLVGREIFLVLALASFPLFARLHKLRARDRLRVVIQFI